MTRRREIEAKAFPGWWRLATSRCTAVSGTGSKMPTDTLDTLLHHRSLSASRLVEFSMAQDIARSGVLTLFHAQL